MTRKKEDRGRTSEIKQKQLLIIENEILEAN